MKARRRPAPRPALLLERDDRVLTVTFDRPEVLNAYGMEMRDRLHAALELAATDGDISALVVQGNGRAFCSGGDLREFGLAPSPVRAREVRQLRDVWGAWARLPCASIAAVHGVAAGGGLEMALLCDFVIASPDARFGLPETALGLIPGVGGTQTLPRASGLGRAMEVVLTGRWLDARAALQAGIVTEIVPRARLRRAAHTLARRVAALDPEAMRAARAAVVRGLDLTLGAGLELERLLACRLRGASA